MAIPILNHLDLRSVSELRNAILHKTTDSSASNVEGKIIYDTGANKIKFYDGSQWQTLGTSDATGDIEGVNITAGAGLSGTVNTTSGTHTQTLAIDLSEFSAVTPTGSDSFLTLDSDGSTEQLTTVSALQTFMLNNLTFTTDTVRTVTAGGNTLAANETLAFTAGSNITITENAGAVTIAATDTNTNTQNVTTLSFVDSSDDIILRNTTSGATSGTDDIKFNAGSNITLTHTDADNITIAATDTNTQLSQEQVEDFVGGMLDGTETFISVSYDDTDGNIDFVVPVKDEDDMASDSNTHLATQQSIKAYVDNSVIPALTTEQVQDIVGGMLGGTETGITVTYQDSTGDIDFVVGTLNQDTTGTAAKVTVSDSSANTNFPVVFHDEGTGNVLLDDTGALRYNPSTGTLLVPNLNVSGTTTQVDTVTMEAQNAIVFEGATSDAHETTLTITDPTADRTITLPNSSGTVALTSDLADGIFKTVSVSGQDDVVADSTTDTLTLAAGSNVTITTNASSDTITIASTDTNTQLSTEQVQDIVGAMFSGNTETRIAATYQDGDGTIDLVVDDMTANTNTQLSTAAALIDVSAMGSNSTASFTHGLSSKNLIVQLYDTTSGLIVHADVDHTSNNAIAVTFAMTGTELVNNSIGDIRVVVIDAKDGLTDKTVSYS